MFDITLESSIMRGAEKGPYLIYWFRHVQSTHSVLAIINNRAIAIA